MKDAPDSEIYMDSFQHHYRIPHDLSVSAYKMDILVYPQYLNRVNLLNITIRSYSKN